MAGTRTDHKTRTATSALVLGAALLVPVAGATATSATAAPAASAPRGSAPPASATAAASRPAKAFEKRPFYTRELGLAHPTGATFLDGPRVLAIAQAGPRATAIRLLDPRSEKVVGRVSLKARIAPSTLADNGRGRLAALAGRTFVTWKANARGTVRPARRTVTGASVAKVRSMTYDPQTRSWLGLDAARSRLVTLRAKGHSMRAVATGRVAGLAGHTPVGVAYDPATRRVYVADPVASKLVPVGQHREAGRAGARHQRRADHQAALTRVRRDCRPDRHLQGHQPLRDGLGGQRDPRQGRGDLPGPDRPGRRGRTAHLDGHPGQEDRPVQDQPSVTGHLRHRLHEGLQPAVHRGLRGRRDDDLQERQHVAALPRRLVGVQHRQHAEVLQGAHGCRLRPRQTR